MSTMPGRPVAEPRQGGALLSEITNRIVSLVSEHYGRGPLHAKTYVLDDMLVCVMSGGLSALEQTMLNAGRPHQVRAMRSEFQAMMRERYRRLVGELTGRRVLAVLSQASAEPDVMIEMFLMDGALADVADPVAPPAG